MARTLKPITWKNKTGGQSRLLNVVCYEILLYNYGPFDFYERMIPTEITFIMQDYFYRGNR